MPFTPDKRQQRLIDEALRVHRQAQTSGLYVPDRLVKKWSGEVGIGTSEGQPEISTTVKQTRVGRVLRLVGRLCRRLLNSIRKRHG